jgi:hypothetical protein
MPTNNWTENLSKTTYKHKSNPSVVVLIRRNLHGESPKYFVYHSHPAPGGRAVMQEVEGAMSMESARRKAEKHMRHWENPQLWKSDGDYAKLGKRGA